VSTTYAYEQYFGLREHPFSITPDPRFVYLSESHRAALEHLDYGATGNGFVLLSGDVGTGKTTICRTFLERLPPKTEVVLILNPVLTLNEFLLTICDELDLVIEGNRDSNKNLIDNLNRFLLQVYAVGHKTILIVDEAQNLTHELLEQIRLLTNLESNTEKLLQIFLIGQPELRDMLKRPELLQVSQRITSRFHLGPLNKKETRAYIERRLEVAGAQDIPFTASAIRRIYAFSKGVPRLINVLCDKALLSAYQRSAEKIDAKIIHDAERRVLGNAESSRGVLGKAAIAFGAVVALAAVGFGAAYWTNLGGVRPWFDSRVAEFQDIEAGRSPAIAPPPQPVGPPPAPAMPEIAAMERRAAQIAPAPTPEIPAGEAMSNPESPQRGLDTVLDTPAADRAPSGADRQVAFGTAETAPEVEPAMTTEQAPAEGDSTAGLTDGTGGSADAALPSPPSSAPAPSVTSPPLASAPKTPVAVTSPTTEAGAKGLTGDQTLDDYTRRYAERKLLSMWGVKDASPGLDFCRSAAEQGLSCLNEASGLAGLHRYDRPAILYLTIGEVSSYAVVMKASPDSVVLDVLDRRHVIPANALGEVWDGKFLLLWRQAGGFKGNLALGTTGPPALWLRRAIDQIEGRTTSGDVIDEPLVARVRQFQREQGLTPDGIVGPRTFILLQNKLAASGSSG
jgi:general secretion pathway protein A